MEARIFAAFLGVIEPSLIIILMPN